jgi:predicted CXXCH cytochrome family protein
MKRLLIIGLITAVAIVFCIKGQVIAAEPHGDAYSIACDSCHIVHKAPGAGMTNNASNANLCQSCHSPIGPALNKPLNDIDQAVPGSSGTSHRWDTEMPAISDPNNQYGLRAVADLTPALKSYLTKFGNTVTCSVCHNQHSQSRTPWDPFGFTMDLGTATGGSTTDIQDTSKAWTTDQWAGCYVKITSGANALEGSQVQSNDTNTLTVSLSFFSPVAAGDTYYVGERHFQRVNNDITQMCEDCHYYRRAGTTGTDVRTYDGNKKSHPVFKIFTNDAGRNVTDSTQFNDAPLEPASAGWAVQTGARYQIDGGSDTNLTNNIVVDSSKQIRCLSCHGIHYTDSDSGTEDIP